MQTERSTEPSAFGRVEGRPVAAEFDGRALTSDAGAGVGRGGPYPRSGSTAFAVFPRRERPNVRGALGRHPHRQRVLGIALGYEDLNDHDELPHDP